jgi:hypothetical protein
MNVDTIIADSPGQCQTPSIDRLPLNGCFGERRPSTLGRVPSLANGSYRVANPEARQSLTGQLQTDSNADQITRERS